MTTLDTDRLTLRPLTEDDGEALHAAFSDEETLRYWHQPVTTSVAESRQRTKSEAEGGEAVFAIREKHGTFAIGFVGFVGRVQPSHQTGFGYLLRKEYWGKGYVAEAARAVLAHGFGELGVAAAELWIYDGNAQSRRVAEKLGARYRGAFTGFNLLRGVRVTHVYEIPNTPLPPEIVRVAPVLSVGDLHDAIAWYRDTLNFAPEWVTPTGASMVSPGWMPSAATIRLRPDKAGPSRVVFAVPDRIDEVAAAVGAVVADQPWGLLECSVTDPWGNVLTFESPTVGR